MLLFVVVRLRFLLCFGCELVHGYPSAYGCEHGYLSGYPSGYHYATNLQRPVLKMFKASIRKIVLFRYTGLNFSQSMEFFSLLTRCIPHSVVLKCGKLHVRVHFSHKKATKYMLSKCHTRL